jgi:hypothetical protein
MKINERTYQGTIVVLVIVVVGLMWWIVRSPANTLGGGAKADVTTPASTDSSSSATSGSQTPTMSDEDITVQNQGAGTEVTVAAVMLSEPSWIAIRDANGRTLGAGWFPAGTHKNVQVPLLRTTASGQSYQALLYADDGDKKFDLHKDVLITSDGSVAGTSFKVQ